ncbi:major facilitator superfamily domain-containing protein [Lipomyces kononenkoae]|uniref:Major facilitator superfamily domain-containing protein n=1 Tax=Lipomyces kononenkoae TaxID=34357 RepID=A0ACC3SQA0_LIPKO
MVRLLNVYTTAAFVALGGGLFGFEIASMSGIIGTEQYRNYFGNPLGTLQGIITGAMAAGSLFGALFSSFLGDRLSRKIAIQVGAALWCIGTIIQSTSNDVAILIAGRAIAGLCIGLTSALIPIYQSEIAPHKIRGRIVVFQTFAITWGIMIQYFIEYGCSFLNSTASFRVPWAIQSIPAMLLFIGLFWFPCTPREDQIRLEREKQSNSYRELFSRKIRKRIFLSIAVQMWAQLSGMNVMMYYIIYILQSAGIANWRLLSSIQYVINMIMTIPAMLWIDKWGRRPALLLGAPILGFILFGIGGLLKQYGQPNAITDQPYTLDSRRPPCRDPCYLYLAVATFAVSWGPVALMYPPEVVPLRIRAKSVALATRSQWASNFALAFALPPLLRSIRWRVYFIFGSFNFLAFIHVLFAAPETKCRTLEETDEIFEHGEPLWKSFLDRRESNKLEVLARDIEMGVLIIERAGPCQGSQLCSHGQRPGWS